MTQKLTQLTAHTWLYPHHPDPNKVQPAAGIITAGNETILVDPGNGPPMAQQIRDELQKAGLPPVSRIIYTHHHWDHIFGACAFQVPIVAHTLCSDILKEEAKKPWGVPYLRREIARTPKRETSFKAIEKAVPDWDSFHIVVPDQIFDTTMTLQLGTLTVELEHIGGLHAEDSILVKIPQERVIFIGDCYYPPPLHLRAPDSTHDTSMLSRLASQPYDLYVEGHDDPFNRIELLEFLASPPDPEEI